MAQHASILPPLRAALVGLGVIFAAAVPQARAAGHEAQVEALYDLLSLGEIIGVMREEGLSYGTSIAEDLFPNRVGGDWAALVDTIYAAEAMEARVRADFATALDGADLAPMIAFFEAEPGRSIISLEVSARAAMLDDAVEEAARETAAMAIADETERAALIERFVTVNDLIETNVVGAMNANFAFYAGLLDGGALGGEMTESDLLQQVWASEPEIRQNTADWVNAFLTLAYQPLSDADLETYIAFSQTPEGAALNDALFSAFDGMYVDISRALGLGAARFMVMQDL